MPARVSICCPGGGVFFWWQLGAVKRLLELYELPADIALNGSSAGALAICLAQCRVQPRLAHKVAFGLAEEAGVMSNPFGLLFAWGRLVYAWLDQLLPEDAGSRCSSRCRVTVTHCFDSPSVLRAGAIHSFGNRPS